MQRRLENLNDPGFAYASYFLIKSYQSENRSVPSGLYFNKAMSFVNAEMKKRKEDIKLPHSWYRWGDEVVRYYMPRELTWTHEEAGYTKVNWEGTPPRINYSIKNDVEALIKEFLQRYPVNSDSWYEELLADHYDGAPFEFQRAFKSSRDILFDRTRPDKSERNYASSEILLGIYKKAFSTFPSDKLFHPVKKFIPTFLSLIAYPLSGSKEDLLVANEISEEFWYWFCYFLRVHPLAHENIDEDTVAYWKSQLEPETSRFFRNFDDYAKRLSEKFPEILKDDLLVAHVQEETKRLQEWEERMANFEEIIDGLDDFLSGKIGLKKNSDA
jgi:hypothetical protein